MTSKWTGPIIVIIAIAVIAGAVAAATYLYPPSNTTQITGVTPAPTPTPTPTPEPPTTVNTFLSPSAPTVQIGSPVNLIAQLSMPQAGVTVNFYEGTVAPANLINSAVTDGTGRAVLTITLQTEGLHTYIADPEG